MGISIGGAINAIGDGGEKLVNKGKKMVGSAIEHGAHIVGDGLEKVGLDGAADWVEDKGDALADHLGAHVGEQQLGQSEEPEELLHGDPGKVRKVVMHLAKFALAFESGHEGLTHLDPGDWEGFGADAFRAMFKAQPEKWAHAATACAEAGLALEAYAETLDWARGQATEAVRLWKQGVASTQTAMDSYNASLDTYHDAVKAYNDKVDKGEDPGVKPVSPGKFVDPGAADRQAARDTLTAARQQRNSVAAEAVPKVKAATQLAPPKPQFTDRMKNDFGDVGKALPIAGEHFVGGVVRSVTDFERFTRGLNPWDPYNITHPAQYLTHLNATTAGLVDMAAHPERLPGTILGTGWGSDGSEASGRLLGNILFAIATDGGSAAGKTAAEGAAKNAAKDAAEQAAKNTARGAAEDPAKAAIEQAAKKCVSDPIDVATGDMILAQTDISLPGTLPLVLERTHLSSYRIGRFFGPSWASTLDQRLELDDQGVAFVAHDGSILLYPIPQPGVPVLPSHGPRWPLEWDGHPGSPLRITDTHTGRALHFTAAPGTSATPGGPTVLNLTEVSDRNGNTYTITYDDAGVPTDVHHCGGYHLTLDHQNGRITALHLKDPAAPDQPGTTVRTYGHDETGNLTAVTNSSGLPHQFTYDAAGRITSWTDRNDTTYAYTYDTRGRCTATHGSDGYLNSTLAYDDTTRTTTFTNSLGHTTTYTHNAAHRLIAETDPLGHTTTRQWDPTGHHLTSVTDPLGHTTSYTYDDAGNLTRLTLPDGTTTTAEYNAFGQPLRITERGGATSSYTYDERGNRTSGSTASGQTTRFAYDEAGRLTGVTDALGGTTAIRCCPAGLPAVITDPLGAVTRYERDGFGRPVAVTDPAGATTRLQWTVEGRPAHLTAPDGAGESWTYDGEGNCVSHTDPGGGVTRSEYTHFDLLAARTTPAGDRYTFDHDTELRLARVTNPQGLSWSYAYDPAGRLKSETDFDNRTLAYGHDSAGRLTRRTDGLGQTSTFEHNELDQITRKTVDGHTTTYAYDLTGQLTHAVGPDGSTLTLLRDRLGRLTSETTDGRTVTYAYDAMGRRTSRTTPSGAHSTWTYDAAGNRARITTNGHTIDFTFDAVGRERSHRIDQFATVSSTFDRAGRLTAQAVTGSDDRLLQNRAYTYRADGSLIAVEDRLRGLRRFDLDASARVTAVHAEDWTEAYTYDSAGNQATANWPTAHRDHEAAGERAYAGTRITRAGNIRYEHDPLGRVTLRQRTRLSRKPDTWRYEWDAEHRLTSVVTPDGTRWRYTYDPLGRRTAKLRLAADGETVVERTDFTWDGTTLCEQTTSTPGRPRVVTLTWDHQGQRPLAQTERTYAADEPRDEPQDIDSRFFAIVTDLVGTPCELVDERGDIAWRTRSTLWGITTWNADATGYTPLRFPGQYDDPETGLHYNFFRHYDPATARYTTPDPLGLAPAPNPATYVNNPHTLTDPLGLIPCDVDPTIPESAMQHVLHGGLNKDGEFGGWHLHPGDDPGAWPENRYISGELRTNPDGSVRVVGGKVGHLDPNTWEKIPKQSILHTFFPKDWDANKIAEAGRDLFTNGTYKQGNNLVTHVHDGVGIVGTLEKGLDGVYRPSSFFPG